MFENDVKTISVQQACRILGCGRHYIYTLIKRGEIKAFRTHYRYHIYVSSLKIYMQKNYYLPEKSF